MQPRRGSALAHFAVRNCRIELLEDLTSEKTKHSREEYRHAGCRKAALLFDHS